MRRKNEGGPEGRKKEGGGGEGISIMWHTCVRCCCSGISRTLPTQILTGPAGLAVLWSEKEEMKHNENEKYGRRIKRH